MPEVSDVLGWSAFLLLLLRYFGFGTFAIAYWDASVFVRVAIQVHAASRGSSLAAGGGGRRCRDGEAVEGDRRTRMGEFDSLAASLFLDLALEISCAPRLASGVATTCMSRCKATRS